MDLIVRRSKLIVPLDKPDNMEKVLKAKADVIILDPGNFLCTDKQHEIQASLKSWIPLIVESGADAFIFIKRSVNYSYLETFIWSGLNGITFFGAESEADVQVLDKKISDLEKKQSIPVGTIQIDIVLDTAKGIWNVYEIVNASMRIVSVGIDAEELAKELGIKLTDECDQFAYVKGRVVVAARSREKPDDKNLGSDDFIDGIQPHGLGFIGSASRQFRDSQQVLANAKAGYDEGFRGAICTSLSHIQPLNDGFNIAPEAVAHAKEVVQVMNRAMEQGSGSASINGQMVDVRSLYGVKRLADRSDAINTKEKLKNRGRGLLGKTSDGREN